MVYRMRNITTYISEKLRISSKKPKYTYVPKESTELIDIIYEQCETEGNECDLNCIDTSNITNMNSLFVAFHAINPNISEWDVSNVTNMAFMFSQCKNFNCDISEWDVHNVNYMECMFLGCDKFNQDISGWDVSNVYNMRKMFYNCKSFNQDLSGWDLSDINYSRLRYMFDGCSSLKNIPSWYER